MNFQSHEKEDQFVIKLQKYLEDVCFPNGSPWEDWIIHQDYFDNRILTLKQPRLTFNKIIELL